MPRKPGDLCNEKEQGMKKGPDVKLEIGAEVIDRINLYI